jgi:hypothetical protein
MADFHFAAEIAKISRSRTHGLPKADSRRREKEKLQFVGAGVGGADDGPVDRRSRTAQFTFRHRLSRHVAAVQCGGLDAGRILISGNGRAWQKR